jgi:chromate reductase, NAD(P)H dehydrogenase (quinone)
MKILAFAASNSKNSINKKLVTHVANLFTNASIEVIDLNDFELPIYGEDIEKEIGQPQKAKDFLNKISKVDLVLISFAEYNGNFTGAYKNIFDWASRINRKVYQGKPMLIMATSPGPSGAKTVLNLALHSLPYYGADIKGAFSLPSYHANFSNEKGIVNVGLKKEIVGVVAEIEAVLL